MAAPNTFFFAARHLCTNPESCFEAGLEGRSAVLYVTFGCGEAAWSETLTSLGTCHAPSHLLCQVHWKLYLRGFFFKRGQPRLENSPAMQANVSASSFSHMLWLKAACLADLKALQGGCVCPCPALVMLRGAGILTPPPSPRSPSPSHVARH